MQTRVRAWRDIPQRYRANGGTELVALTVRSHNARSSWVDPYRMVIQGLQLIVAAVFMAAFVYALVS